MNGYSIQKLGGAACAALVLAAFSPGAADASTALVVAASGQHLPTARTPAAEPPDPCVTGQHQTMMRKAGGEQETTHGPIGKNTASCASRTTRPGLHPLNPQPLPPG
jgi:hypothetical protein